MSNVTVVVPIFYIQFLVYRWLGYEWNVETVSKAHRRHTTVTYTMTYTLTRIHTCTHVQTCMKWNSYPADYIYQIQRITSAETGVCSHVWLMIFTAMAITGKLRTSSLTHTSFWWCHVYPLGMIIQGGKCQEYPYRQQKLIQDKFCPVVINTAPLYL